MSRQRRPRRCTLVIVIIAMIGSAILATAIFRSLREATEFYVPDQREAATAQALFTRALAGDQGAVLGRDLEALGFELRPIANTEGERVIREIDGDCRGRGLYRLRERGAVPLALIAPHRGFDRGTGQLAEQLMAEFPFAAAAWNSAPRKITQDCPGGGDPTRVETHYLTAFSLAFAATHPGGRVVQLHGFDRSRRESSAAQLADAIISEGSDNPAARLLDVADCLSVALHPARVLVYPGETRELGATQNRQGQALRAGGFDGFVHLEMSAGLRERLLSDGALRARLGQCLGTGLT
ncbi:hypothetical protein [Qipengyuania marisflavi]|uniref:Uncharacterized protein n=1 Tax=Qipengyuania marisflavi TaxID=2486356 RepID=A0A5S3P5T9_9SPHN|nr:hypothetical protein [Qipengyuania marisflavi]TMM48191.1 hypothetical protein FEV51_07815 [Qipengyuania marisflavi]